jgi:hypothetical protein
LKKIENPIKNTFELIFSKLLKKSEITQYKFLTGCFNSENQVYSIRYEAIVGGTNAYKVKFVFEISLKFPEAPLVIRTNAKKLTLCCSYMYLVDSNSVYLIIIGELKGWRKGEVHERLFQKRFLKPFQKKYPEMIHDIVKTSDDIDTLYGVDFIIQFKMAKAGVKKELHFNLKSSPLFLKQHTALHPNVSTFVFIKDHLKDKMKLEKRFLLFMSSALSGAVNF